MAHVLIIEPDAVLAKTYRAALERVGHKVDVAHNAQQAVDAADKVSPDVIILELQLANHNGVEFLYEFRSYAEWQTIPVIILTNVPPDEIGASETTWKQLGVASYHYKPKTTLKELVASINSVSLLFKRKK